MPPRSFVALLVLVALLAPPAAGLGSPTPPGAPAGDTLDRVSSTEQVAVQAQQATATPTAGSPTGTAGTPGGTDAPPDGTDTTPGGTDTATPADRAPLPPSEETWRLRLEADGDARWQISVTIPIRNAEDAAAFEDVAAEFGTVENPLEYEFFRRAAAAASAETGREMAIEDVSRSTSTVNGTGTLSVSFTWTNFARVDGNRLAVGDGFNTTRGTWLPSLHDQLTLVVVPPSGYGVTSAPEVGIVDGAARWDGPYDFTGREPWIVYSGDAPTPTPTDSNVTGSPGTGTGTDGPDTPGGSPFESFLPVVALAVVAGASAAVLVVYMRSEDGPGGIGGVIGDDGSDGDGGTTAGSAGGTGAATDSDEGSGAGATGGTAATSSDGATAGGSDDAAGSAAGTGAAGVATGNDDVGGANAGDGDGADGADDGIDEELLSDEERVERLLERNGGRMKQATIVKETGWSNAKVSQLLSAMAEDGRVDKLRIGRENLISFPDEDVTDIDSSSE